MATSSTDTLGERVAALEERMNTKQQEYKTDIAKLENRIVIVVLGAVGLATALLGVGLAVLGMFIQAGAGTP